MTPAHNPDFKGKKMKKKVAKKGTPRAKKPSGRRSAPSKKPFRLEVGKYYKARNGKIVGPLKTTPVWSSLKNTHPYVDNLGRTYTRKGGYLWKDKDSWDLIREVQPKSPKSPKGRAK